MSLVASFVLCGMSWNLYFAKSFKEDCTVITSPTMCTATVKCQTMKHRMQCSDKTESIAETDILRTNSGQYAGYLECAEPGLFRKQK